MNRVKRIAIIGISAGGPPTLRILLPIIKRIKNPVIIVQHIPETFTNVLIDNLKPLINIPIIRVDNYTLINQNAIYFCPGGYHTVFKILRDQIRSRLYLPEKEDIVAPSIDKSMISIADLYEKSVMGIIMTGMTGDGVEGISYIKKSGGITIAQDESSSVIFGMPRKAIEAGCIDYICDIKGIAHKIDSFLNN